MLVNGKNAMVQIKKIDKDFAVSNYITDSP
jgi:hypothetical protein